MLNIDANSRWLLLMPQVPKVVQLLLPVIKIGQPLSFFLMKTCTFVRIREQNAEEKYHSCKISVSTLSKDSTGGFICVILLLLRRLWED